MTTAAVLDAAKTLRDEVDAMTFAAPVAVVYNPLVYAWRPHAAYINKFARPGVDTILLGMNPGPFGMAQCGVPFGEVALVQSFLGIREDVDKPAHEHPKRRVEGFNCQRSEVSGRRLWGFLSRVFVTPDALSSTIFIANYCPLVFMEESSRNRTPDKLPLAERETLFAACDRHLQCVTEALAPKRVIGVGKFAEGRAKAALAGRDVVVGTVLHPSPASPAANRDWEGQAERSLRALGVPLPAA